MLKLANSNVEVCPCCGQKIVVYKHKLNKTLISSLVKLWEHNGEGKAADLGLTNSQFANFQKLTYFGLVDKNNSIYILTEKGRLFLKNLEKVPSVVYTKNAIPIKYEDYKYASEIKDFIQVKEEWQNQASKEVNYGK